MKNRLTESFCSMPEDTCTRLNFHAVVATASFIGRILVRKIYLENKVLRVNNFCCHAKEEVLTQISQGLNLMLSRYRQWQTLTAGTFGKIL